MSESAAPLGSSRCTSGAYLRSYTARRIEQQKIIENEDTEFRLLKRIASEESDAHAPVHPDQPSIGTLATLLRYAFISRSYSFNSDL